MNEEIDKQELSLLEDFVTQERTRDLGTLSRAMLWLRSTKELLHPRKIEKSELLRNSTEYSEDEFYNRDVHIFGDSFAQGFRDPIQLENGKVIIPEPFPAPLHIRHRLKVRHGINWRIHNHAVGGSTTEAARDQVTAFRCSGETDKLRPDFHTQVGGINFIELLNNPQTHKDLLTIRRLFEKESSFDLLRSRNYLQDFFQALNNIPIVVKNEVAPFKASYKKYLEELLFGGTSLPRRLFIYGQPNGGVVDLLETQMLAVSEDHRESVKNLAGKNGKGIISQIATNASEILETAAHEVTQEIVMENKTFLESEQSDVLFIRYRNAITKRQVSKEHLNFEGNRKIAEAIEKRCIFKGQTFTELTA